jgi:hypothetical protein
MVSSVVGNTVTVSWSLPSGGVSPTGYILEGGVTPGSVLASLATGSTATTYTFTAPTGSYYIRLYSVASGVRSSASNEVLLLVGVAAPPSAPSAPSNLTATVSGSSLALSWVNTSAGGAPTGINLDVTGAFNGSIGTSVTESFSLAAVPSGTYTISVRAFNAAGSSGSSNSVTFTIPGGCSLPGMPANFNLTANGSVVAATWSAPGGGAAPTSYIVSVTGGFTGQLATTGLGLSGTVAPGSYTVNVLARNACGDGPATASRTITIP